MKKMNNVKGKLKKNDFFSIEAGIEKWYLLGVELQFLEELKLRRKCDPDMLLTWRALYDIAPEFSPTGKQPTDKERAEGIRNHYLMCYRLAKFDTLEGLKKNGVNWRKFNDIYMSFGPAQWKDRKRLLEWVSMKDNKGSDETKTRLALQAIRRVSGSKSTRKNRYDYP